jgi:hypothetical protein
LTAALRELFDAVAAEVGVGKTATAPNYVDMAWAAGDIPLMTPSDSHELVSV